MFVLNADVYATNMVLTVCQESRVTNEATENYGYPIRTDAALGSGVVYFIYVNNRG